MVIDPPSNVSNESMFLSTSCNMMLPVITASGSQHQQPEGAVVSTVLILTQQNQHSSPCGCGALHASLLVLPAVGLVVSSCHQVIWQPNKTVCIIVLCDDRTVRTNGSAAIADGLGAFQGRTLATTPSPTW
jgi:hypothetical protein